MKCITINSGTMRNKNKKIYLNLNYILTSIFLYFKINALDSLIINKI